MTPPPASATTTPSALSRCGRLLASLALILSAFAPAQDTASIPQPTPQTIEDALHQMSDSAGVIFVGEVIAIRNLPGENGASGVVEVDFRVDQAVRGPAAGATYTLREWAGLWAGGEPRYRTGQRLLILLDAPGPSGITSPVGGMAGAIPIRATTPAAQAASASTATSPLIADLRWVGTRLQRSTLPDPTPLAAAASSSPTQPSTSAADASVAAQQAPVSVVVGMLSSWQPPQATQP
ncbi:hypothetical protein [Edaphobacter aggregans]|uniref:hypothetical protein n=1 Tax=Edaphobacter aggregans TaxID=570835 RepID=UPI0012F86D28|nr:hypothetical protein [Edaphobacter aggregans]